MKLHLYDVLLEPLITEKSAAQKEQRRYSFRVHKDANKTSVKAAVEKIFNVHVEDIHTSVVPGKWKRVRFRPGLTSEWKKASVTLREGEKIEFA